MSTTSKAGSVAPNSKEEEVAQQIATGLMTFLKPLVADVDNNLESVYAAQAELATQIDRLNFELKRFAETTPSPAFGLYTQKLQDSQRILGEVGTTLGQIDRRLTRLSEFMAAKEKEKASASQKVQAHIQAKAQAQGQAAPQKPVQSASKPVSEQPEILAQLPQPPTQEPQLPQPPKTEPQPAPATKEPETAQKPEQTATTEPEPSTTTTATTTTHPDHPSS